jgi:hypothetical protein
MSVKFSILNHPRSIQFWKLEVHVRMRQEVVTLAREKKNAAETERKAFYCGWPWEHSAVRNTSEISMSVWPRALIGVGCIPHVISRSRTTKRKRSGGLSLSHSVSPTSWPGGSPCDFLFVCVNLFMVCLTVASVSESVERRMVRWWVNNELERTWNKTTVA